MTRETQSLDLESVMVGDRIDPLIVPKVQDIEVGETIPYDCSRLDGVDDGDELSYGVRLVAHGYRDQYQDVQSALVYDPEADLFARISGHTNSGAWNQKERDYKVRDVGRDVEIVDQWDVEIPDLDEFGETEEEFVAEWADILFDNIRYGDEPGDEIQEFDGKKFRLRDYDGREARVQYELDDSNE